MRDIAKAHNKPYPYDVRMRILGTTEQMTAKIAVNELHLPITVDEFKLRFSDLGRKRLANVPLFKGILDPRAKHTLSDCNDPTNLILARFRVARV